MYELLDSSTLCFCYTPVCLYYFHLLIYFIDLPHMYGCLCNPRRVSRGGSRGLSSQVSSAAHTINGTILFLHIFCCAKFPADELAGEELICHQNRKSENPQSDKTGTMS